MQSYSGAVKGCINRKSSGGVSSAQAGVSDPKRMQRGSEASQESKRGKRFFFASFALITFFISSAILCAQQSRDAEEIRLGAEFELKIDQRAVIKGEGLAVVFESVLEDSRCPEGVDCIWSGNARIRIRSSKQGQTPATIELNTDAGPKSSSYLNYEVRLVELKPRPKANEAVRPHEYKAALMIKKK
jgi:hypothetical protein